MNKRFFAEFLALLSLKVNPDPDANDDAEIDIVKQIFAHNRDSPSAPEIPTKFPDDTSVDFYDEEESTGVSCISSCKDNNPQETRYRWDWMLLFNLLWYHIVWCLLVVHQKEKPQSNILWSLITLLSWPL